MNDSVKTILQIFLIFIIIALMVELTVILQPFVLAVFMALIFQPLVAKMKSKRIPNWIILPVVSIISLTILGVITYIVVQTALDMAAEGTYLAGRLNDKFSDIIKVTVKSLNLGKEYRLLQRDAISVIGLENISSFAGSIAKGVTHFSSAFVMFILYYVMLLAGMSKYKEFMRFVGGGGERGERFLAEYEEVHKKVIDYLVVKNYVSLMNAVACYIICLIFGVRFAFFWMFLAYVTNYIPAIGAAIGSILPTTMCFIQYDTFGPVLLFFILIFSAHFVIANIVEPIMMSNKLSINTVTVLLGLFFWGAIWGMTGMLLSVPLLVIMRLILERIPNLSAIGRLMGSAKEAV